MCDYVFIYMYKLYAVYVIISKETDIKDWNKNTVSDRYNILMCFKIKENIKCIEMLCWCLKKKKPIARIWI